MTATPVSPASISPKAVIGPAPSKSVLEEMKSHPYRFDFFQAIRRIESLAGQSPRVGHSQRADREPVRIRQTAGIDFAPATLDDSHVDDQGRFVIGQRFFGLWGPAGPLPLHMTEQARDQLRHDGDATQTAFVDIFHHRMAVLFYRAWSSSRGAVQRDRPDDDRYASFLAALAGVLTHKKSIDSEERGAAGVQQYFAGRFVSKRRNADGLQAVVSTLLQADVSVQSFVLRRLRLQREDHSRLVRIPSPRGRGGRLGQGIVLGRTVADRRSTIGMTVGPVRSRAFQQLLPGGSAHGELCRVVRHYLEPGIDCRVRLVLDQRSVPRMALGRHAVLGRNTWVHSRPPQTNASQYQFQT